MQKEVIMKKAIFPGSFDPLTRGHMDIIKRACKLFDELIVVILNNSKKTSMFTVEERISFLQAATQDLDNVRVADYEGLTVEFARAVGACCMVRGVRSIKDYEYEMEIAAINQHIASEIETLILFANPQDSFVSSSAIKEMVAYGQSVEGLVSEEVYAALLKKC